MGPTMIRGSLATRLGSLESLGPLGLSGALGPLISCRLARGGWWT